MKKLLSVLLVTILVLTALPLTALPTAAVTSGDFSYSVISEEDKTCEITGYTGSATKLTIPSKLSGYTVTSIGDEAFSDCTSLTSVTIPDSVTRIGDEAFYNTAYYNDASHWENDVLYIGNHLIEAKNTLSGAYTVKAGTKTIADYAFYGCTSLTSVTLPDSVTSIGNGTFSGCTALTSITIPDSVTSIGNSTFRGCTALTSITIPDSAKSIGSWAFHNCTSLTSITIPDSVTSIDDFAFDGCTSLTSITIPNSVTDIGRSAFYYCTSLTNITIPDSVTSIGDRAFSYCTSLVSISIPNSVTSINEETFYECKSLTSITIPESVTKIYTTYTFDGCTSLTSINVAPSNPHYASEDGILFNKKKTELIKFPCGKTNTTYVIPSTVNSIGTCAFKDCTNLENIIVLYNLTHIGSMAFYNTAYYNNSANWCNDGLYIGKNFVDAKNTVIGTYSINPETKIIADAAFSWCTSLESITIPDSVTSIGEYAFYECSALTSITIPDSVTSIGDWAFADCTSLSSVTLGNGVQRIGEGLFQWCISLTNIIIPSSVTIIGSRAFRFCDSLASITVPDSVISIEYEAFRGCDSLSVIKGYSGSEAETYANQYGYTFIDLSSGSAVTDRTTRDNVTLSLFDKNAFLEGSINFLEEDSASAQYRLNGVRLTTGNIQQDCDSSAVLTAEHLGSNVMLSKNGYQNYTVPAEVVSSWFGGDEIAMHNVYMAKDKMDGKPYISGAFAKETGKQTAYTDLQSEKLTVLGGTAYDVILTAELRGETVKEYVLSQDDAHKVFDKTGVFSAEILDDVFVPNKAVYAYVITTSGKTSEPVKLKMSVTGLVLNPSTFSLVGPNGQGLRCDTDAPLVGGAEISLDGFTFPLGIEIEGNRFKISFGVDAFSKKLTDDGKWKNDTWDSFKKSVSTLRSSNEEAIEKIQQYNDFVNTYPGFDKSRTKNFDVSMLGYAEGYIVNGDMVFTDFSGEIAAKFKFKYTQQGTIWVIPVYAYVEAGAAAAIQLQSVRKLPDKDVPFDFGINLDITPELKLGGGVGVKGAVSGGLYGKGTLPIGISFTEKHATVKLSGKIGIEGEFFFYNGNKTLLDGTVTLFDDYYVKKTTTLQAVTARMFSQTVVDAASTDATGTQTSVLSRDYAKNTSKWLGNSFAKRLFDAKSAVSDGLSVQELQTSVFKNSQANVVALSDGSMMMAWIEDDGSRDEYNRMRLVYSVYKNGLWSTPKAVADDGTNDGYPTLATDGATIYVAWQNIRRMLSVSDSDSIQPVLTNSEICLAKYNISTGNFDAPTTLTDNILYDFSPSIAVENGQAVVYWQQNKTNDLTTSGGNAIYRYSTADNACTLVKSNLNYILDLTCTWTDGKEAAAFSMDTDGDLTTVDDVYTYTLENGVMSVNMTNEQDKNPDFSVVYGKLEGEDTLFFADNTAIYYVKNGQCVKAVSAVNCFNGDLQIAELGGETKLLWTEVSECGTELWMSGYADGAWTNPVQISNLGTMLSNVSIVSQNGTLHGIFNRTERTLIDGEYTSGQTDLCYMTLTNFTDLEGSFVTFDESDFSLGEIAEIPICLKNNGTTEITQVQIALRDGLGTNQLIMETVDLPSGADEIVYIKYPVPNVFSNTTLSLTVSVPNSQDSNTENNEDSITIGHTDVSIGDISVNDVGQYYILTTTVANTGLLSAKNVRVNICQTSEIAAPMDISILGDLQPHEICSVQFIVEKSAVEFDVNNLGTIYFVLFTDSAEQTAQNNKACALLEKSELEPIAPTYTLGDLNGDDKINAVDARWVLQAASGVRELTDAQKAAADLNSDGKINAVDARWILQVASGARAL